MSFWLLAVVITHLNIAAFSNLLLIVGAMMGNFVNSLHPDRPCAPPPNLLSTGNEEQSGRVMKLTIHFPSSAEVLNVWSLHLHSANTFSWRGV